MRSRSTSVRLSDIRSLSSALPGADSSQRSASSMERYFGTATHRSNSEGSSQRSTSQSQTMSASEASQDHALRAYTRQPAIFPRRKKPRQARSHTTFAPMAGADFAKLSAEISSLAGRLGSMEERLVRKVELLEQGQAQLARKLEDLEQSR